jgi:Ca-activated chloride channel family protein
MRFFDLDMFYLMAFVALSIALYVRERYKKREKMRRLGDEAMVRAMCSSVSGRKRLLKVFLKLTVMTLIILAMARPKAGLITETVTKKGIDLIVVLDVSKSMLATDTAPNRFERAKLELLSLVDKLKNDRIGLVLFSGTAFMQMPLTLDYSAAKLFIKNANIDTLPQPGTAGSAAIDICLDVFSRVSDRERAIVMFTDGEFHDKGLIPAANRAKDAGVLIFAVGLGTEAGGPIPVQKAGGIKDFKKDKDGNVVLSKMNRKKLKEMTRVTGGVYFTTAFTDMAGSVKRSIEKLERKGVEETRYADLEEKFYIPLFLAGILLIIESVISDRRKKEI